MRSWALTSHAPVSEIGSAWWHGARAANASLDTVPESGAADGYRPAVRIALVYRSFELTGSLPRFSVELARFLSRSHEIHVFAIARRTDRSLVPGATFHDVPVSALGDGGGFSARELLSFARNAATLLGDPSYDIVHVRAPSTWCGDVLHVPGVVRGEAAIQHITPARLVATTVRHPGNAARWLIERRALANRSLRRIHVDAPSVRDDLVRYHGFDPEDVVVAVPGVNLDEFHPADDREAARAEAGLEPSERFTALFCGHDFERKGLDRAIEALAAMRSDAELLVVGSSPDETRYRALASDRGVAERVRFLGARSDAAAIFRAADAFVLPTRAEIWGATVVEAMASGTPPVVTSVAGAASAVTTGVNGVVLPEPFAIEDLRDALEQLATDSSFRRSLAVAGRDRAARYSWEEHGRLVEADLVELAAASTRALRKRRRRQAATPR